MSKKGRKSIEALAWEWTDKTDFNISDNELQSSYHLLLQKCNFQHKNCSGNPCCLHGLGQTIWTKSSLANNGVMDNYLIDLDAERRINSEMVGLKNLGATCYVNTYLQLWFNNLHFRKAIYDLSEEISSSDETDAPATIYGQLQLVFGLLQCSTAKSVDPSSFINSLGLPIDLQQDAQEFSKLFMCMLESTAGLSKVIQSQFCGSYAYITKCLNCSTTVETASKFYELDLNIQGHKNLESCILEFLKPEQLENENQYFCEKCSSKQDATRQIVLKNLPPTLNIQLLRFVYDRSKQRKHKLNTNLIFPEKLDFSKFVSANAVNNKNSSSLEYNLTAVLLHRGLTASSGHYVANILDCSSNSWFQFNDENVAKIKSGRMLNLEFDTNTEESLISDVVNEPLLKRVKLSKGNSSSKGVYMLVYSNNCSSNQVDVMPPSNVMHWVAKKNSEFETCLAEKLAKAENEYKLKLCEETKMKDFIKILMSDSKEREWIPTIVLKEFLHKGNIFGVIINWNDFLCKHGKLSLTALNKVKYISNCAADIIYHNSSEFIRMTNAMCYNCVYNRCMLLRGKKKLTKDKEIVSEAMKEFEKRKDSRNSNCFYVGRISFRKWKQQVLHKLLQAYQTETVDEASTVSDSDDQFVFNSDLLCSHQNLTADLSTAQTVPEIVWDILIKYFPDSTIYKTDSSSKCTECVNEVKKVEEALNLLKVEAKEQKNTLSHLYFNKNRPKLSVTNNNLCSVASEKFFVVSADFVDSWRDFVRQPSKEKSLIFVQNKDFLCQHNKLQYDLLSFLTLPRIEECCMTSRSLLPPCVILWENEWDYIVKKFNVDFVICIEKRVLNPCSVVVKKFDGNVPYYIKNQDVKWNNKESQKPLVYIQSEVLKKDNPTCNSTVDFISIPKLCVDCIEALKLKEEEKLRVFEDAEIYISKSSKTVTDMIESTCQTESLLSDGHRKSRRCVRGEKKLTNISSVMTLKQLKVKIMALFSVPPFDQNLWLNGLFLKDDEATLGSLSITPGSTLVMVEDLPDSTDMPLIYESNEELEPEVGFLGTNLLGHSDSQ